MLADDIMTKLGGASIGLTAGTNLFEGEWQDSPDTAAVVYETGGFFPIHAMSASAGNALVERPRIQIVTRAKQQRTARQLMHNIVQTLDGLSDATIGSTRYLLMTAVSSPATMGRDGSGRMRFTCSFDIVKKMHTSTST